VYLQQFDTIHDTILNPTIHDTLYDSKSLLQTHNGLKQPSNTPDPYDSQGKKITSKTLKLALRCSARKPKWPALFPGLVATSINPRTKQRPTVTPKDLKHALVEAGLNDALSCEIIDFVPLPIPMVNKITDFVSLDTTTGLTVSVT
jgi:hypothetical protein